MLILVDIATLIGYGKVDCFESLEWYADQGGHSLGLVSEAFNQVAGHLNPAAAWVGVASSPLFSHEVQFDEAVPDILLEHAAMWELVLKPRPLYQESCMTLLMAYHRSCAALVDDEIFEVLLGLGKATSGQAGRVARPVPPYLITPTELLDTQEAAGADVRALSDIADALRAEGLVVRW